MKSSFFFALFLVTVLPALAQTAPAPESSLPKDPAAILAAAAPYYNYNDPSQKPFHLKATYQIYDDKGNPAEKGTYEYWWASPTVHRSSWSRPGAAYTSWTTGEGQHSYLRKGGPIEFFEDKLEDAFLNPLPSAKDLAPGASTLEHEQLKIGSYQMPCVMVMPIMPKEPLRGAIPPTPPVGTFPTYCFDPALPILRISFSMGSVAASYDNLVKAQGKFLAKQIAFYEGKRKILTASMDSLETVSSANPAFTPDPGAVAQKFGTVPISAGVAVGQLLTKVQPYYPDDAKAVRVSGTVVLQATIGIDGIIHELRVVSTPWPSLAASALWAVSQWRYKPYLFNGEPVEVETTVNVIFTLGG